MMTRKDWQDLALNCGQKHGFSLALKALECMPILQAKEYIQQQLETCEDIEISLERKMEPLTPKFSCI